MSLVVAGFLWFDPVYRHNDKYRYTIADVRLLKRMVARHLTIPHEFVCITDDPDQFAQDDIRAVEIDRRCWVPGKMFQQLMSFHPQGRELFGERLIVFDLDCVITGNLDAIVQKPGDLVLWRNPGRRPWNDPQGKGKFRALYNGSLMMIRCGSRPAVWAMFSPNVTPLQYGDSQDYISVVVGSECAFWDDDDGVYRFGRPDTPGSGPRGVLPDNARVVFFPGDKGKPWLPEIMAEAPWIGEHRR